MKKLAYALTLATIAAVPALAADAPAAAPTPDYTFTANAGVVTQYIYRGITQSAREPAIQGGFDMSHKSGFYLGTWGSSISWFSDANPGNSVSMEWDLYGGYKGKAGPLDFDVGLLEYYYPGRYINLNTSVSGVTKPNTTEVYGALSKDWLSAKLSYVVSKGLFGVNKADGSYYLDVSANYPIVDTWTLNAHVGYQKYTGTAATGLLANSSLYTYTDYKLGVTKDLGSGWSAMAYYSATDAKDASGGFYAYKIKNGLNGATTTANGGKNLGDGQIVLGVSRSF